MGRNMKKAVAARRDTSIRTKLFIYLTVFIFFTLTVIWVFQVRLLDTFYASVKKNELDRAADAVQEYIKDEILEESSEEYKSLRREAWRMSAEYSLCVRIFHKSGQKASDLMAFDISGDSVLYNMTNKYLNHLYNHALGSARGEYIETRTKGELESDGMYEPRALFSPERESDAHLESTVLIRVIAGGEEGEFLLMLNAEMTPVSAVVKMLTMQYFWILSVLLVGALVLALIISKNISKPIERMNREARLLAHGNYNVNFSGEGFSETRELADTLNYAAQELSVNDNLQKELIANISHDLRTPLTMISGYGEVMRDIPGENTPENVQVIIDEATRLSELVNDLLDISKLQAGAGRLEISTFNLTETVRATMQRYLKLTERDGMKLEFYFDCDVFVSADRKMILQVLYNLINNAISYTGPDRLVKLDQRMSGGFVRISVIDSGEGIPPDQLPLIWERYYKLDKVHRRASVGTGIGLSIVKGVLELHGAKYGVDSIPGSGSTFYFELPVKIEGDPPGPRTGQPN